MLITAKVPRRSVDTVPRALCISIYPQLTEHISKIAKELSFPVDIYEGGIFSNGHFFANEVQEEYDVIVSQAGTAASIQNLVHVPLVSINITALDFIKAFEKASHYDRDLVLISYQSKLVDELNAMAKVFARDRFCIMTYSNKDEFQKIVKTVLAMDKPVVMGFGSCIQKKVEAMGIPYILVNSRSQSIRNAILSAKKIIDQNIREKRHARRMQNLINYSRDGIISVNSEQAITVCNVTAKRMLKLKNTNIVNTIISSKEVPNSLNTLYGDGKFTLNSLHKINEISYVVSRIPIIVRSKLLETIITFQKLSQIQKVEEVARVQLHLKGLVSNYTFEDILHQSKNMNKVIMSADQFASTHAAVLIEGETGTGKELMAQSIHSASPRRKGPFVAINCAALPEHLLESELFGYEEGAFTGAKKGGKPGVFELAHNGTIFLDEIGEISLHMQARLLRVVQEKQIFRLGGERNISVNVRIVSATNKNLYRLVEEGLFRRDLFFRINILPLFIPPLRERLEDIPLLIRSLIKKNSQSYGINLPLLNKNTIKKMKEHAWPGNVRELFNIVERACIIYKEDMDIDELFCQLLDDQITMQQRSMDLHEKINDASINIVPGTMKEMESSIFHAMLERVGGNHQKLAEVLGISRVTVWKKLKNLI